MTHICESKPDQCIICLKFERDKLRVQLKASKENRDYWGCELKLLREKYARLREKCVEAAKAKHPLFEGKLNALNKIEWQIVGHVELKAKFVEVEKDAAELKRLLGQIAENHCFYTCPSDAEVEGIHEAICHDVKTKLGIPLEKGP